MAGRRDWERARERDSVRSPGLKTLPVDHRKRPTPKQLTYLESLCDRHGVAFVMPSSAYQASIQINLLKARR